MRGGSVAITGRRRWSMASTKQQFDDVAAALRWRFDEDWGGGGAGSELRLLSSLHGHEVWWGGVCQRFKKSRSDAVLPNQGPPPLFLPTRSLQLKPKVNSAKIPDGLLCKVLLHHFPWSLTISTGAMVFQKNNNNVLGLSSGRSTDTPDLAPTRKAFFLS